MIFTGCNSFYLLLVAIICTQSIDAQSSSRIPVRTDPNDLMCLGCICQAISNCDLSRTCEGDICGPFGITWPYWADAGKPTLRDLDSSTSPPIWASTPAEPVTTPVPTQVTPPTTPEPESSSYWIDVRLAPSGSSTNYHVKPKKEKKKKTTPSSDYAQCTINAQCASTAVAAYLRKYAQDCNGDGVINCYDYASIHMHGGYSCRVPQTGSYFHKFDLCMKSIPQI